jgi:hypothetical protein
LFHAPVDHTEAAAADLMRLGQADRHQLPGDIAHNVMPGYQRIVFDHQTASLISLRGRRHANRILRPAGRQD